VILYGRNAVREALRGRRASQISEIWATSGAAREPWLAAEVAARAETAGSTRGAKVRNAHNTRNTRNTRDARGARDVRVHTASSEEIERRCGSSAHQGVCAQAGGYPYVSAAELLSPSGAAPEPLIVALDEVQDPQNLGSICRTAECVGASGVAICERRAAEVTPAVCKASAGAVEHLRIARVRNLADFLDQARKAGCWCYGASAAQPGQPAQPAKSAQLAQPAQDSHHASGRRAESHVVPVPYDTPDYRGAGVVLVLGSEGHGLRPRVAKSCDQLVALPVRGRIASLNVSAAAAALLYEILQARGA
jgi:23S rRNA (guanosine2251-2'-O)-methyltransferase